MLRVGVATVDAARDCHRVGFTGVLPTDLLRAAHSLYLDPSESRSSGDLFNDALSWTRTRFAGASSLMIQGPGWGDRVFDYLLTSSARTAVSPRLWFPRPSARPTLFGTLGDESALSVMIAGGNRDAERELIRIVRLRGDTELLEHLANNGSSLANEALWTFTTPEQRFELTESFTDLLLITRCSDHGGMIPDDTAISMVNLLVDEGNVDQLEIRADRGEDYAASRLAELLADRKDVDRLRTRTATRDPYARLWLIETLARQADADALADLAAAGNRNAAMRLAEVLVETGDVDQLESYADAEGLGSHYAARLLADLLVRSGDLDALARRADTGDHLAKQLLNTVLVDSGDIAHLRERAASGDEDAAYWLVELLALRDATAELDRIARTGNLHAAERLNDLGGHDASKEKRRWRWGKRSG